MASMSLALNLSAFRTKSGRCLAEQVGLGQLNVVRIGCDLVNDNGSFTLVSGDLQHKVCADVHRGRHHKRCDYTVVRCVPDEMSRGLRINVVNLRCWPQPGKPAKNSCSAFSRFLISSSVRSSSARSTASYCARSY